MRIVLSGPQGAGKGTYAELLSDKFNIPQISPGNLLREIPKTDPTYKKIHEYTDKGDLIPGHLVDDLVKQRIKEKDAKKGFILDGYPREKEQAIVLNKNLNDQGIKLDRVFFINIPKNESIRRISGRMVCKCGETYNTLTNPPKIKGKCDKCGGSVAVRDDDKPAAIEERLKIYHKETEPLKEYYKDILYEINGMGNIETVFNRILEHLQ